MHPQVEVARYVLNLAALHVAHPLAAPLIHVAAPVLHV